MLARASTLRVEQKRRVREAKEAMSPRARWLAKRSKKAYFRSKYACSGYRLIKLQQQDPDSFYIGVVGANWSGRVQALKAIENYLKRATELKASPCAVFEEAAVVQVRL